MSGGKVRDRRRKEDFRGISALQLRRLRSLLMQAFLLIDQIIALAWKGLIQKTAIMLREAYQS